MITCMGIVVGAVTSANRQDVLNQCARFLHTHRYLLDCNAVFVIDGQSYAAVLDTCDEHDELWVLFEMYDGHVVAGIAQLD